MAWLLSGTLEWWYEASPVPQGSAEAIVVLSGYVSRNDGVPPVEIPAADTYVRCRHAAWLYHHWQPLPIVACGGKGRARAMQQLLIAENVPPSKVILEDRSRSTFENAAYAAEMLRERGIRRVALVTEAHHMLRAQLCFERQGIEVVPAPCAFRTQKFVWWSGSLLPGAAAVAHNEDVVHEWLGLLWYLTTGRL